MMFEGHPILGELPAISANRGATHLVTVRRPAAHPVDTSWSLGLAKNQDDVVRKLFYGDPWKNSADDFNGLSTLYSTTDPNEAQNAVNVIDAKGHCGASIWLVCWGEHSAYLAQARDKDNEPLVGLVVEDWRYIVRVANIDEEYQPDLLSLMSHAGYRVPTFGQMPRFYMGEKMRRLFAKQVGAEHIDAFRGIPVRHVDVLHHREFNVGRLAA